MDSQRVNMIDSEAKEKCTLMFTQHLERLLKKRFTEYSTSSHKNNKCINVFKLYTQRT